MGIPTSEINDSRLSIFIRLSSHLWGIIIMPSVRIAVCIFLAFRFFNDVSSYNPYRYNSRFFPTINQDAYATMGDIDWSKRSLEDVEDEDSSMPLQDEISTSLDLKRSPYIYKSYKYRQPYMLARRPSRTSYTEKRRSQRYKQFYQPYRAYARYGQAIPRPEGRQYSYASMADMDWGWKKRSQLPALMGASNDDADDPLTEDKRNLASLAKNNFFPREYKRSVDDEDANDSDIEEEKRHLGSFVRGQRAGLSSLARNGALRGKRL